MKLGSDCIRDILLTMEKLPFDGALRIEELCEALPKYEAEEVHYTALKLIEADLIDGVCYDRDDWNISHVYSVIDITFAGHQFLAKIRDDNRWGIVKRGLSSVRDYSLSAIGAIAEGATSAAISAFFSQAENTPIYKA